MKKKLISRLLVGALLVTSVLPLAGNTSAYAADKKKTGWNMENGDWYYYNEDGTRVTDTTITIKGQQYQFDKNGVYQESEENRKAADEQMKKYNEEMKTYKAKYLITNECSEDYKKRDDRWTNKDGNWYFDWKFPESELGEDAVIDDWDEINGYWYHFNKDGVMDKDTTIKDEAGNDCVLNSDGILTNRKEPEFKHDGISPKEEYKKTVIDGNTYYINNKGEKLTGWYQDQGGKWYYLDKSGKMQKNTTVIIDGNKFVLGSDGAWIQ